MDELLHTPRLWSKKWPRQFTTKGTAVDKKHKGSLILGKCAAIEKSDVGKWRASSRVYKNKAEKMQYSLVLLLPCILPGDTDSFQFVTNHPKSLDKTTTFSLLL